MIDILIITSAGANEFSSWILGDHGVMRESVYEIVMGNIIIHVVNGKPNDDSMTLCEKANCVRNWLKEKKSGGHSKRYVLIHGRLENLLTVTGFLNGEEDITDIDFRDYSSQGDGQRIYRIVEKFFNSQNQAESVAKELISALVGQTWQEKQDEACRLRAEILSPLVALDLLKQAEGNNTLDENDNLTELRENIRTAIDDLEGPIDEFCKVPIKCDEFKDRLRELMKPEYHSSWEKYHKDLKNVAEQMETQIAAIET